MVTLTNDSYLLQMFSVVQLDACLLQVCFCLCGKLSVVTMLLMFHMTGQKDKKQRNTRQRKMCPLSTSDQQLVGGLDLTCALHPVMAL